MNRAQRRGRFTLLAKLRRQLAPREPIQAGVRDVNFFELRQPLYDMQGFPGDRRLVEVQFLQPAKDAELPHRGVGDRAAGEIQFAKLQQSIMSAYEVFDELFAASRVIKPNADNRFR